MCRSDGGRRVLWFGKDFLSGWTGIQNKNTKQLTRDTDARDTPCVLIAWWTRVIFPILSHESVSFQHLFDFLQLLVADGRQRLSANSSAVAQNVHRGFETGRSAFLHQLFQKRKNNNAVINFAWRFGGGIRPSQRIKPEEKRQF